MLTVDYERLGVGPGDLVLDLGCGFGRHAFEAARRGASVVALDAGADEVAQVRGTLGAMVEAGELAPGHPATAVQGDALALPFADATFDRVIASEVLEHIPDDTAAMRELARVLRPGGAMAVTVPRCVPEAINWALSDEYHDTPGGHVRIYRRSTLERRLSSAGLEPAGYHHAHGLHTPYWWLRCLVGPSNDTHPAVDAYHKVLVWDIVRGPFVTRDGRPGAQPADRKEPGALPDQTRRRHRRRCRRARRPAQRPARRARAPRTDHADPGSSCMTTEEIRSTEVALPEVPGILTSSDILATGHAIAEVQRRDGMIPWFDGGHCDPWNHVEAAMALTVCGLVDEAVAAYRWLARRQLSDGSWFNYYQGDTVKDPRLDTNVCAYLAAGAWHHHLITGDVEFLGELWPTIETGIDFILRWQQPDGSVLWSLDSAGRAEGYALLTGSSSIYHSLRCAVAVAESLAKDRPDWELAAGRLGHAVAHHPGAFAPKVEFAMDWYYPVLSGALEGEAGRLRVATGWSTFVMDGLGVRCVSTGDWVTAAETAECVLTLNALGMDRHALDLFAAGQNLRLPDGSYWTGMVYPEQETFPKHERTTYTFAAMVLAADALSSTTPAAGLFRGEGLPAPLDLAEPHCGDAIEGCTADPPQRFSTADRPRPGPVRDGPREGGGLRRP